MGKNLTQLDQIEEIKGTELTYVLDVANGKDNAATIDQLKQYIADNSKTSLLDFAFFRTSLCKYLFENAEKITNVLMEELLNNN